MIRLTILLVAMMAATVWVYERVDSTVDEKPAEYAQNDLSSKVDIPFEQSVHSKMPRASAGPLTQGTVIFSTSDAQEAQDLVWIGSNDAP